MHSALAGWERIERWLSERAADRLDRFLLPPATEAEIRDLEAALGQALTGELRAWLGRHAGTTSAMQVLEIMPHDLLPLWPPAEIAARWRALRGSHPWWDEAWLPLSEQSSGSVTYYLCVDLARPEGRPGRLVVLDDGGYGREGLAEVAPGLDAFFAEVAGELERGGWEVLDDDDLDDAEAEGLSGIVRAEEDEPEG